MRKSIFTEYFNLCSTIIAGAILCVGALLVIVSSESYKYDQRDIMKSVCDDIKISTQLCFDDNVEPDREKLKNIYINAKEIFGIDFILTDKDGNIIVCNDSANLKQDIKSIDKNFLVSENNDSNFSLSTMNNSLTKTCFIYSETISMSYNSYHFVLLKTTSSYSQYIKRLITIYIIASAVIIVIIVLPIIFFAMRKILRPIKEMTLAAKQFGEGDFSKKLYITEDNELGFLANSLNEMASSLATIEQNRKSFVSNVSHELKTPMTTIGGFVDGILDGTIPKDMHRHYLKIVSSEVNRLSRLVRSMLNISKYESGEVTMTTENFDIVPLVAKTVFMFEQRLEVKEVDVEGLDSDSFIVNADKDLILQVIYNLVENAVKFVNNKGYLSFDFSQTDNDVTVKIRNSGQGLKEAEISKVFDRFYKADESRGIDKSGVGLGLSIVSSIIRLHKGKILVRSEWNEYVEFEFTLKRGRLTNKK